MILTIDPGLRGCGAALFYEKSLAHAFYVQNPIVRGGGYKAHANMARAVRLWADAATTDVRKVIIEFPRIYPHAAQQKGDPNDLLELTGVGGAIAALFSKADIESRFPAEWKGQVPKDVMVKRIQNALDISEKASVRSVGAKDHNTWDAVGIGLAYLGRLHKKQIHY